MASRAARYPARRRRRNAATGGEQLERVEQPGQVMDADNSRGLAQSLPRGIVASQGTRVRGDHRATGRRATHGKHHDRDILRRRAP
jgi:hypothetical protein